MDKYNNEDYLKREIMEQSRHLFIYGYNNEKRSNFLKELEKEYPLLIDSNKPVALYFDSLGFKRQDVDLSGKDKGLVNSLSREYMSFSIVTKMLERSMGNDEDILNSRLSKLINLLNSNTREIKNVKELLNELKSSRDFFYENYYNYINGITDNVPISKLLIPFIELEMFTRKFKACMNINSYFGIIVDKKTPLAISSVQAINGLIYGRINSDISIKVALEPDDWEIYRTLNGDFIESIHDYGCVELDDSYEDDFEKIMKKYK